MRHFEFVDDTSNKFWNIELEDNQFTVTYGRIGTQGQTQTKTFANADKAQTAHDKLVEEKLAKGYVETTTAAQPTAPATAAKSVPTLLERAIIENPGDLGPLAAYADHLTEQGDPRGEFIALQLALEDESRTPAERTKLKTREEQLLKAHRKEWVGPWEKQVPKEEKRMASHRLYSNHELPGPEPCHFIRGCLAQISINRLSVPCARELAACPQTRLVWRLAIGEGEHVEDGDSIWEPGPDTEGDCEYPSLQVLLGWPGLANLRFFQFGYEPKAGRFNCTTSAEMVVELVERMPRLEELHLFATRLHTDKLFKLKTLQHLRVLRVYHSVFCDLERLARNPAMNKLTHLLLHPHATEPGDDWYIRLPGVRALLKSPHLKNLTHLQLRLTDMGDAGCEAIVQSGILKRLRALDVRQGTITDEGVRILAACPDTANLELLDLSKNALTEAGIKALRAVNPRALPVSRKSDESCPYDADIE